MEGKLRRLLCNSKTFDEVWFGVEAGWHSLVRFGYSFVQICYNWERSPWIGWEVNIVGKVLEKQGSNLK